MSHQDPDVRRLMRAKKLLIEARKQLNRLQTKGRYDVPIALRLSHDILEMKVEIRNRDAFYQANKETM